MAMILNKTTVDGGPSLATKIAGGDHYQITYPEFLSIVDGQIPGIGVINKHGYVTGLGSSVDLNTPATWETIWAYGGMRELPPSDFSVFCASDDAADAGKTVLWNYMDSAGALQQISITLNGLTPVDLGITAKDLYRGKVTGSSAIVGNVTAATTNNFTNGVHNVAAEVLAYITPIDQKTQILAQKIPAGFKGYVVESDVRMIRDSGADGSAFCVFEKRPDGGIWTTERNYPIVNGGGGFPNPAVVLDPLDEFRMVVRDVSDVGTTISAYVLIYLVQQSV